MECYLTAHTVIINSEVHGLTDEEQELIAHVKCVEKESSVYGMEINTENSKLMTQQQKAESREKADSLKYWGSLVSLEIRGSFAVIFLCFGRWLQL